MLALTLVLAGVVAQSDAPQKVDISKVKADLKILTDGKGHYLVYPGSEPYGEMSFYGDGKTFHQVPVKGGGRNGDESFDAVFWEPRFARDGAQAFFRWKDGKYSVECAGKSTELSLVPDEEAKKMLDGGAFLTRLWLRLPERLLRDENGTYYFIDRYRPANSWRTMGDRRDFRVFVGKRGRLKQVALKDIVDDSEGMIFSTKTGTLRLIAGKDGEKDSMKWVQGKKELNLINVPLDDLRNVQLVYTGLGPYDGKRLGTPCDDMM